MRELSPADIDLMLYGVTFFKEGRRIDPNDVYFSSPVMEHKLEVERRKNAAMRTVVDLIRHPTDR